MKGAMCGGSGSFEDFWVLLMWINSLTFKCHQIFEPIDSIYGKCIQNDSVCPEWGPVGAGESSIA